MIPKYRKRVLTGKIALSLQHKIYEAVKMNEWWVEELKILPDHTHILIQIHPEDSLSDVVQILKGGTSRLIKKEFSDLDEFVWGDEFWARGYYAETIGAKTAREVKRYIEKNNEKYATLGKRYHRL